MNFKISREDDTFVPAIVDVLDLFDACEEMSEGGRFPLRIERTSKAPSAFDKIAKEKRGSKKTRAA